MISISIFLSSVHLSFFFKKKQEKPRPSSMTERLCSFPGCTLRTQHKGICNSQTNGCRARTFMEPIESPVQKGETI